MKARVRCSLFATDLDGTILVDRGSRGAQLPLRTLRALRALQARGVTLCLASGRMHESVLRIARSAGLSGPVISCNGALTCLEDGERIEEHRLDPEVAAEVVELAEARGLALNFYRDGEVLSRRFHPWWDLYEGRTCSPMRELPSLLPLRGEAPLKLLLMAEPARIRELQAELKPRFAGRACVLVTADEYLEFMPPLASKGRALQRLAERLGVPREEVVAAGDGYNDLDMIRFAGLGLAVETGRELVRREADCVVAGPEQEGVAAFIEEQLL